MSRRSVTGIEAKRLRAVLRKRPRAELKAAFALIRRAEDKALFAALTPPRKKRRQSDALAREVARALKPVIAPAREKAEMLVEHMAKKHRRKLDLAPKGVADAIRGLRESFTDDQIASGAGTLAAELRRLYGDRETVV